MIEWIAHLFMWTTIILAYGMIFFQWGIGNGY